MAKHSELDDAQRQVQNLQEDLRRFKTELVDIEISADLHVSIDGFWGSQITFLTVSLQTGR